MVFLTNHLLTPILPLISWVNETTGGVRKGTFIINNKKKDSRVKTMEQ